MARVARRAASDQSVYQLKVVLAQTKPPIWRRLTVPPDITLGSLHQVIQEAFGWHGGHLHVFEDELGYQYGAPELDSGMFGPANVDEETVSLAAVAPGEGSRLEYTYDFGDDWRHRITVEKVLPAGGEPGMARCTDGRRADPPAEDIGGVEGLQALLAALADPSAEDDEYAELVDELRAREYDPAAFDAKQADSMLSVLPLRQVNPAAQASRVGARGGLAQADVGSCACSRCQAGEFDDEDLNGAELLPAVALLPEAELVSAVRAVPLFDAVLRLADWCAAGRKITSKGVLKPELARQAVRELELWRLAPEHAGYADEGTREAALAAMRSAGDLAFLDTPWRLAHAVGLIEANRTTVRSRPQLSAAAGDRMLLEGWAEVLGDVLDDVCEQTPGSRYGMLGSVLAEAMPDSGELAAELLKFLYCLPDDEWLEAATVLAEVRDGLSGPAGSVIELVMAELHDQLTDTLRWFGAAEIEGTTPSGDRVAAVMAILVGSPVANATQPSESDRRTRLTPLGRYGIRRLMLDLGHEAPAIGQYAQADAATLLDVLPVYPQDAIEQELAGWLTHRTPADGAAQLLDACVGMGPEASARRRVALSLLVSLGTADERVLPVLGRAAASNVEGCRQLAAVALKPCGVQAPGHDDATMAWLMIDNLVFPEPIEPEDAVALLTEYEGGQVRQTLAELADVLWRSDHPATADVLATLGEAARTVDKGLAKRLRTSAHKARTRR